MNNKTKLHLKPEDEVRILREITQTISSNLDMEEVLKHIIEAVVKVTKGDSCLIYLFDENKEELILRASKNPHSKILGKISLRLGEGITGWVAKEKKPVIIPKNASDDHRFKLFHNLPEDKYQSFLSVPIISRNEVIGVINVQHKRAHGHKENEIALLSTIAQQVGYAIENARLYEDVKRRANQIELLKEALEIRKAVERAKGILMKDMNINEDEAYRMIHRKSMDSRKPMKEIAEAIILSSELRKGG